MKQAFARNVGILFIDNSRVAGVTAQRYEGRYTVVDHGLYTACNICRENPDQTPLWQVRSESMTHDSLEHEVYYHDATIEFADIPILYTPYMSMPDPTVKRKDGFLASLVGTSSNIGTYAKIPYYFDLAPDKDMTVTTTFSTVDTAQFDTQYRERLENGKLVLDGSTTYADLIDDQGVNQGRQLRGHLFGNFVYNIDNVWRASTDLQYVSDKSYLSRYNMGALDQATTHGYLEGFKGRDYASFDSYYFEDLRPGVNASQPVIFPSARFSALGDPGQAWGGRWSLDGNTLETQRNNSGLPLAEQGPDTRRLSVNGGWERQMISNTGAVTTISGLMRADSYWADNVVANDNSGAVYNNVLFTRQFEQGNAVLRYPMGRSGDGYQQLLEPIAGLTLAPSVRQIAKQPIEDSLDVEFDETNLFSPNRFTGNDLIEGGSRATYGLRHMITTNSGGRVDIFGGESYNFSSNNTFPSASGLQTRASDYVGRVDFEPADWMKVNYGFRFDQANLSPQRQDVLLGVGAPVFRPSVRYLETYQTDPTTNLVDLVRQATLGLSSTFATYWSFTGNYIQSFDPQPGPRLTTLNLLYADECFAFGLGAARTYTTRVGVNPGTTVGFHFYLKNLGGIHTDTATNITYPAEFRQTEP